MTVSDHAVYVNLQLPAKTHTDMLALARKHGVSPDELVTAALETFLASEYVREQMETKA